MNLRKIVCLALIASVSGNVLAAQIYKGKILSEKLYSSDGSKAVLAEKKHAAVRSEEYEYLYNTASIPFQTAKINVPVKVDGYMAVSINNHSKDAAHYIINNHLCSETSEGTNHCVFYQKEIELAAGGSYWDDAVPLLKMTYSKPGHYKIWVQSGFYQQDESSGTWPINSVAKSTMVVA